MSFGAVLEAPRPLHPTRLCGGPGRWALDFISARSDSDLFPPTPELQAIQPLRQQLLDSLTTPELQSLTLGPHRRFLVPKDEVSYRQATQQDPQDALILTLHAQRTDFAQVVAWIRPRPLSGGDSRDSRCQSPASTAATCLLSPTLSLAMKPIAQHREFPKNATVLLHDQASGLSGYRLMDGRTPPQDRADGYPARRVRSGHYACPENRGPVRNSADRPDGQDRTASCRLRPWGLPRILADVLATACGVAQDPGETHAQERIGISPCGWTPGHPHPVLGHRDLPARSSSVDPCRMTLKPRWRLGQIP